MSTIILSFSLTPCNDTLQCDQFLVRDLSQIRCVAQLNEAFTLWLEDTYHQRLHTTLGMKPIKLRLMLEDFPKNHNLILIGQSALNTTLQLHGQLDLKQVNAVLMQPHWRHNSRDEPAQPLVQTNKTNHKPRPK